MDGIAPSSSKNVATSMLIFEKCKVFGGSDTGVAALLDDLGELICR